MGGRTILSFKHNGLSSFEPDFKICYLDRFLIAPMVVYSRSYLLFLYSHSIIIQGAQRHPGVTIFGIANDTFLSRYVWVTSPMAYALLWGTLAISFCNITLCLEDLILPSELCPYAFLSHFLWYFQFQFSDTVRTTLIDEHVLRTVTPDQLIVGCVVLWFLFNRGINARTGHQ